MDFDNSGSPGRFFVSIVRELKSLAITNIEYFKDGKHSHHAKFHVAFCMLFEYLDLGIEPCFREISLRVHEFDASPTEKGNGYRSLLRIVQKCCLHLLQISRHVSTNRESVLFRRAFYMKELEAYVATLGQLRACLYYAQKLMTYCQAGQLFADEETLDDALAEQLMTDVEMLSQDCFYGRCLGFQFCDSMQRPLNVVAIAMASFAEGYQENSQIMKVATSLFNSGKYIINPDLRAQQVVNVTRTADIQFCKAFWSITEAEIMHHLPSMVCPSVQVDEVFHLGPDAFSMPSADGSEEITIAPPCAHTGPAPVQVRLISFQLREGQEQHLKASRSPSSRSPPPKAERSRALVVHCHGGGFVAQSSRSHEVYLRHWARDLNVPILSIDYSLAPESPFPRALEECFYVYAWAVHNCHKLGSTGEVIVLAGDSAGANLVITTAMRATSFDIRRPDGILGVYTPVLVRYTPSPARLLSLMDPLLPAGILSRCLAAYAGVSDEVSSQLAASVSCHIESSAATLRLSSQENHDNSDWVMVSQDSAARTNTTRASCHGSGVEDTTSGDTRDGDDGNVDQSENGTEEVELFSRPRVARAGTLSNMVTGATDKLVSYVGSYSHLLAKTFSSSAPQNTPEQIPLLPIPEHEACDPTCESSGSQVDMHSAGNSGDSPPTPNFHTPLSTPSGENVSGITGPNSALKGEGNVPSVETDGDMVDVSLDDAGTGSVRDNRPQTERGETPGGVTDGGLTSLDDVSLLQLAAVSFSAARPADDRDGGDEDFAVCNENSRVSLTDSNLQESKESMEAESCGEKNTLSENPAVASSSSTTPTQTVSEPLSTPSDNFVSFDIVSPDEEDGDDSREERSLSSPQRGPSREEESGGDEQNDSSPSPSYKSLPDEAQAFVSRDPLEEGARQLQENVHRTPSGEDSASTPNTSLAQASSQNYVDIVTAMCTTPDATASSIGVCRRADLLPSPDSGCLSDETDKLETSADAVLQSSVTSESSPSRQNLHLRLRKTTSSSSVTSIPRSASLPTLGDGFTSRSHSMSPSDFKRERHLAQSPLKAIRNIPIVKNPYMSPLLAPDWLIEGLPHICLVACHLDPLLDDSVMFTRRLRSLGKTVELVLVDDLPHGFLNFSLASHDAKNASDLCMRKLRQLLKLD
ncbi:hypothetical protein ACOMHN_038176 [Nucella lapillus]